MHFRFEFILVIIIERISIRQPIKVTIAQNLEYIRVLNTKNIKVLNIVKRLLRSLVGLRLVMINN